MSYVFMDQAAQRITTPVTPDHAVGAANTAVVITLVGQAGYRQYLERVSWSYDAAPSGGRIVITGLDNSETVDLDIIEGGPDQLPFSPLPGKVGENVVITLYAGGAGVVGKLNVFSALLPNVHDYGGQTLR